MTSTASPYARAAAERLDTPAELRAAFQEFALAAAALTTRLRGGPVPNLPHALATLEFQAAVLEAALARRAPLHAAAAADADALTDPCARGLAELAERARVLPGMARLRGRFQALAERCEQASRLADEA